MHVFDQRYIVERELGQGGMGRVLLVTDPLNQGRRVALKEIRPDLLSAKLLDALAREFEVLTRLRHPNLVEVYDFQLTPRCYFTMEYVQGRDLRASELDEATLIEAVVQVCRALEYVHSRGLVHLDIKPSNILVVDEGELAVKLMDFGVASSSNDLRVAGYTNGFVPPEVMDGREFDGRADLYALGRTMQVLARSSQIESEDTVPPELEATVPERPELVQAAGAPGTGRLKPLIDRLLQRDPAERFGSAAQLIVALGQLSGRHFPVETAATRTGFIQSAPLVGRELELAALAAAYTDVKAGLSRHVLLLAAAGIGKSRLLKELRVHAQLDGALVATASCPQESLASYGPLSSLVGQLVRAVSASGEFVARHMADLARLADISRAAPGLQRPAGAAAADSADALSSSAWRGRLAEAFVALIASVSRSRRLVLLVEDAHWIDAGSADLLDALASELAAGRLDGVLLVVTARSDPGGGGAPERLELAPLDLASVRALCDGVFGRDLVPDDLVARAVELGAGSTFFLCELLKLLADLEIFVRAGEGWGCNVARLAATELPRTPAELVSARVRLLPDALGRTLWTCALLGERFDPRVVEEATGDPKTRADLGELARRLLLVVEEQTLRFAHAEVHAGALREGESAQAAPRVQARLAAALARRAGHPANVARLYLGSDEPAAAVPFLVEAGRRAVTVFDHATAVEHFDRALALHGAAGDALERELHALRLDAIRRGGLGAADLKTERALAVGEDRSLRLQLARISLQRGAFADVLAHVGATRDLGASARDAAQVEALRLEGLARYNLGALDAAVDRLGAALALARSLGDPLLAAAALSDRGFVYSYTGAFRLALADHREALALLKGRADEGAPLEAQAATQNNLGFLSWHLGQYDLALTHLRAALALRQQLCDRHGEGVTRNNIGNVLRHTGALDGAAAEYERAIALCRRSGNRLYEAIALNNLGQILEERDRLDAAIGHYRDALALARGLKDRIREGDNLGNLGICLLRAGRVAEAAGLLSQSVAQRRELGDRAYLVIDLSYLAVAQLAQSDAAAARGALDEALATLRSVAEGIEQVQAVHLNAFRVLSGLGERDAAAAALGRAAAEVRSRAANLEPAARTAFLTLLRVNREIAALADLGIG